MQNERAQVVSELANHEIVMTACGKAHSLFLSKEGRVFSSGFNEYGELGIEGELSGVGEGEAAVMMKCKPVPMQVNLSTKIRFIAAG